MKVLYATMQFGRGYSQGTERYLSILGRGLRSRGHDVVYLAGDPEARGPEAALGEVVEQGPPVLAYPTRGRLSVQGTPPGELVELLRTHSPDILHVANPAHVGIGVIEAALLLRIPVVVTVMDYWWLCPRHTLHHYRGHVCDGRVPWLECLVCTTADHPRDWLQTLATVPVLREMLLPPIVFWGSLLKGLPAGDVRRWTRRQGILRDALSAATAVIFPSKTARRLLEEHLVEARCHSIPYGLEERWFESRYAQTGNTASDEKRDLPREPADLVIGYAGALAEHKGVHLLLEALHELGWASTRVRIAGGAADGTYETRLRSQATGLNVEFVGNVASEQMPKFLKALDGLVVPSLWPENLPIVVLEAQASGVPVLASRVGGIAEMIARPECLFEPNSASSLAACLDVWRTCPVTSPASSVATADDMVTRTLAVYEQVCAQTQ